MGQMTQLTFGAIAPGNLSVNLMTAGATAGKAPSAEIRVDQLRSLGTWFNTATHRGGWRVAVLYIP